MRSGSVFTNFESSSGTVSIDKFLTLLIRYFSFKRDSKILFERMTVSFTFALLWIL